MKNQAERVCQLMEDAVHIYSDLFETYDKIFIITPFRTVAESMRKFIISYFSVKDMIRKSCQSGRKIVLVQCILFKVKTQMRYFLF